jgi:hypothetical protein
VLEHLPLHEMLGGGRLKMGLWYGNLDLLEQLEIYTTKKEVQGKLEMQCEV